MQKFNLLILAITVLLNYATAKEADVIKHIGLNAGLESKTGEPDISTGPGVLKTLEGCAKISDKQGRLVFYTDGINVYNREHRQMPNGYRLLGNKSASRAGVVIPLPGSETKYYIITANRDKFTGVRYSIVDMDADGGLGDVTLKNMALHVPAAEKVTSVKHGNGKDFWIVTHGWNSNDFYLYLLNEYGITTEPVVSGIGIAHQGAEENKVGYFKLSHNMKKLVSTIHGKGVMEVFDIDNQTGVISNPVTFESDLYNTNFDIEFSPNSSLVYITELNSPAKIMQYNFALGSREEILNSATLIYKTKRKDLFGALYLGSDGKIYLTNFGNKFLGVIEKPDIPGTACKYRDYDEDLDFDYASPEYLPLTMKRMVPTDYTSPGYNEDIKLEVIPNTSFEELTVNLRSVDEGNYLVEIYSLDGKVMESVEWKDFRSCKNVNLNFNTTSYPSGLYYLVLKTEKQRISKTLAIWR